MRLKSCIIGSTKRVATNAKGIKGMRYRVTSVNETGLSVAEYGNECQANNRVLWEIPKSYLVTLERREDAEDHYSTIMGKWVNHDYRPGMLD